MYLSKPGYIKRLVSRFRKETHATVVLSGDDEKASKVVPEIRKLLDRNGVSFELTVVTCPRQSSR